MTPEVDPRFEAALALCCDRVRAGQSLDAVLASQPEEYRAELARLVPIAFRVSALAVEPSPAFRARLLATLGSTSAPDATVTPAPRRGHLAWLLARPAALVAGLLLVVLLALGGADAVSASDATLPDSPLYQVKTAREWVEVLLARDPGARAGIHLRQIALRQLELERALRLGKGPAVVDTIAGRLASATDRMVADALAARQRGNPTPARQAGAALRALEQRVGTLRATAKPAARPILANLRQQIAAQQARLEAP